MKKLLLFDIDGTLASHYQGHIEAFAVAFKEVYGVNATIYMIDYHGKTDRQIIHDVLTACGVSRAIIDAKIDDCMRVMCEYYVAIGPNLTTEIFDGVMETLAALNTDVYLLGLVTGNLEPIAHTKLSRAHIDAFFKLGGFGNEAADRAVLIKNAIEKAASQFDFDRSDPVILIGDTPRDIDAAKRAGVEVIGVTTGVYDFEQLTQAGATTVVDGVGDTAAFLKAVSES